MTVPVLTFLSVKQALKLITLKYYKYEILKPWSIYLLTAVHFTSAYAYAYAYARLLSVSVVRRYVGQWNSTIRTTSRHCVDKITCKAHQNSLQTLRPSYTPVLNKRRPNPCEGSTPNTRLSPCAEFFARRPSRGWN